MDPRLKKAKYFFPDIFVEIIGMCSINKDKCQQCENDCISRFLAVRSRSGGKVVAWFEGELLVKTNQKPSKRYMKKYLGSKPVERGKRDATLRRSTDKRRTSNTKSETERNKRQTVHNRKPA